MIQDIELLNHIHQSADMGSTSIKHIIELTDDGNFMNTLTEQLKEYENVHDISERMLREKQVEPKDAPTMAKAMSYVTMNMKGMVDHSTSKLSEMVIQGSSMGITNLTKQINDYQGDDPKVLNLANKQVKLEQDNIEKMKKYL